ncbi:MAG: hypothetical protein KME17_29825 [Cyanosarcina radialis HA8281-LM2]|nr:hypothetical protein [Cyanosarcina radialis HA8281-LM2]
MTRHYSIDASNDRVKILPTISFLSQYIQAIAPYLYLQIWGDRSFNAGQKSHISLLSQKTGNSNY